MELSLDTSALLNLRIENNLPDKNIESMTDHLNKRDFASLAKLII